MLFLVLFSTLISSLNAIGAPIIGILSQETYSVEKYFPGKHYDSYIAASYVKFLESAGARVVPVWIGQDRNYYERVVKYTNGILLPGGATYFHEPNGYGEAVKYIYEISQAYNDKGTYYPLMGICLGMQALAYASANGIDIRVGCYSKEESLPLDFDEGFESSKIFKHASSGVLDILKYKNVTYNYHKYCVTEETLRSHNLTNEWKILTRNKDIHDIEFISTMENKNYPFYGLQFHPEKSRFEFNKTVNIPHNLNCNIASQYFADFFIEQCKNNKNVFVNETIEQDSLIYNFNPIFTARNSTYFQLYMFTVEDFREHQLI